MAVAAWYSPVFFLMIRRPPRPTLSPYTTLFRSQPDVGRRARHARNRPAARERRRRRPWRVARQGRRSEEHTSELQSHSDLVCRLLLEKKKVSLMPPSVTRPAGPPVLSTTK